MTNDQIFNENVPEKLQRAMLNLVMESCASASEHCWGRFTSDSVAKDVSGVYRRGIIEDQWIGMKALHPYLQIDSVPYKRNSGSYHEITSGIVKITQSCIYLPEDVPRYAEFRQTLATNRQIKLSYEDAEEEPSETAEFLYSVLTYGIAAKDHRCRPWFVMVQFPDETCKHYLGDGIDLLKKFPDIVSKYVPSADFTADVKDRAWQRKRKSA